nr:ERCC4 domain-containing protein [uncultured Holophaga sp.]
MRGPTPRILVLADDRERDAPALKAFQDMEGVELRIARLDLGDYRVDGHLVVERKSLPDLLASIRDGRLFRQTAALASCGERCMLLLEGRVQDIQHAHMRREAIQGALICISLIWGIPILRALDGAESARLMLLAAAQLRRTQRPIAFRPGACPRGLQRAQTHVLQGLPGIGRSLALRLLEHFGSVEAVMSADAATLRQVDGIGPDRAARIRRLLTAEAARH